MTKTIQEFIDNIKVMDEQLEKTLASKLKQQPHFKIKYDFTLIISKDFKCLYISKNGARYFGLEQNIMINKNWRELNLPTEIFKLFDEKVLEVFRTGSTIRGESTFFPTLLNKHCSFEYILSPIFTSNNEVGAVMSVITDIAAEKLSKITLLNQIERFNQIIDLCPLAAVVVDKEEKIVSVNQAYLEFSSLAKNKLIGKPYKLINKKLGIKDDQSALVNAFQGFETREHYYLGPGKKEWLLNAKPIKDRLTGSIEGVIGMFQNITEHEALRRDLSKIDRLNLIGEMAAGVAHEIRNPMTVVKGYLQFLSRKVSSDLKEQFNIVLKELECIEEIITNFLSLARNNLSEYKKQNLNAIIRELVPLINSALIKRGLNLKLNLAEVLPDFPLNDKEIKQLILNLVMNGIDAISQHGTLTIETSRAKDHMVCLCVADSGRGIPPQYKDKIFDPFFTTKENGTGLGLSVCEGIVRRHNGIIEVESEENKGTRFIINFKLK